jgi:hypothetical protein
MLRKSIITPCVKVASLVTLMLSLAFTPVYAGPAVVNSDPGLKINELLSKELTTITDNSKLDVTVYSTNTISDADAAKINDSIVKGLPGTNYISIVLNKNARRAGGTTSVNLGPDFRDYLSKDVISNDIVIPNRKRYLPDRPTEFVRAVAKDLVTTIKDKKQYKANVDFAFNTLIILIILGGLICVVVVVIRGIVSWYKDTKKEYKGIEIEKARAVELYTNILGNSSFSGYEGRTKEVVDGINDSLALLIEKFKLIEKAPTLKEALLKPNTWAAYLRELQSFMYAAKSIKTSIDNLTSSILTVKEVTKDPLGVVDKIEQERKDKEEIEYTIKLVTEKYNMYNLSYTSVLHNLYKDAQRSSTKEQVKQASKVFCDAFNQESKNIISLKRVKDGLKFIHTYLSNNTNTYYDQPISTEMVDLASEAFTASIPYLDYNNLEPLQRYLDQLTIYVEPLREADKLYDNFNTYRNELLSYVNSIKCSYVNEDIATVKQSINNVVFIKAKEYYSTYELALKTIEQEIKVLTERANKFNSRAKKINNFSEETRKNSLTFLLSKGGFVTFDNTVKQYKLEDKEALYFEELEKKRLEKERQKRLQTENTSVNAVVVNNTPTYVYVDDNLFNSSSSSNNSNTSSNDSYSNSSSSDDSYSNSNSTNDFFSDSSSSSVSFNDSSWSSSSSDDISSSSSSSDDGW